MLFILKIIAVVITVYLVTMLVRELVKIVREKDDYNDKVELP